MQMAGVEPGNLYDQKKCNTARIAFRTARDTILRPNDNVSHTVSSKNFTARHIQPAWRADVARQQPTTNAQQPPLLRLPGRHTTQHRTYA